MWMRMVEVSLVAEKHDIILQKSCTKRTGAKTTQRKPSSRGPRRPCATPRSTSGNHHGRRMVVAARASFISSSAAFS